MLSYASSPVQAVPDSPGSYLGQSVGRPRAVSITSSKLLVFRLLNTGSLHPCARLSAVDFLGRAEFMGFSS